MKNIVFNNLQLKSWNLIVLIIIFFAVTISLFISFDILILPNKLQSDVFSKLGIISLVIYYSKILWFKNYVEWNKLGMNLKLNNFFSTNVVFADIKKIVKTNESFIIVNKNGIEKIFITKHISQKDLVKLENIILNYSQFD